MDRIILLDLNIVSIISFLYEAFGLDNNVGLINNESPI